MSSTFLTKFSKPTKTGRTIEALYKLKKATSAQLAEVTGLGVSEISTNLRAIVRAKKYGVYIRGEVKAPRGGNANIWSIDVAKYNKYMAYKEHLEATQRPPAPKKKAVAPETVKKPKVQYNRGIRAPITRWRTLWQPSSPYYKT